MVQQMSLFPAKDALAEKAASAEGNGNALDEAFAVIHRFRSSRDYIQMLRFIARFPGYSAYNGFLLYLQNPDSAYVATAGTWRRRFGRNLKPGARPLLILAPMSPVRFVFDFSDTEGEPFRPEQLDPATGSGRFTEDIFVNTVHNCTLHGIMVRQAKINSHAAGSAIYLTDEHLRQHPQAALEAGMNYLVLLNQEHCPEEKYPAMVHELGKIFCGHRGIDRKAWWPDRHRLNSAVAELEAESIGFLVCLRAGLAVGAEKFLERYRDQDQTLPLPGFTAILQATNYIEEMGRSRWQKAKRSR